MASTSAVSSDSTTPESPYALNNYRLLGRSGLRVSPVCLGTMTFGTQWGFGSTEEESKKVFDAYYSKGGNFFDTANVYAGGVSEQYLGKFISDKRSNVVLATKYSVHREIPGVYSGQIKYPNSNAGGNSRKNLVESLDASLKRLGTDYIDLFYLHVWEYRTPIEEVVRALDDVVRSGKALYVGISDTPAWVISKANTIADFRGWSRFTALQSRYNLLDRSLEFDLGPMAKELGIGTVPWGVLAEGFLTGKHKRGEVDANSGRKESVGNLSKKESNWNILDEVTKVSQELNRTPGQVALNWQLAQGITSPIIGARTVEQLEDSIKALEFSLTPEQHKRLNTVSSPQEVPFPHAFGADVAIKYLDAGVKIKPSVLDFGYQSTK